MYWVLMAGLQMAVYKQNSIGTGSTYCNIFAYEVLDSRTKGVWKLLPFDDEKRCFTGNAGAYNEMMYMADKRGFGYFNWQDPEIRYWGFLKYGEADA